MLEWACSQNEHGNTNKSCSMQRFMKSTCAFDWIANELATPGLSYLSLLLNQLFFDSLQMSVIYKIVSL